MNVPMNNSPRKFPFLPAFIFLVIILLPSLVSYAKDKMNGPPGPSPKSQLQNYGAGDNVILDIYQKWISPVKGGNTCPMYPACSQYAKISFRILPWYEAYINSLERLLRCCNDLNSYHIIRINGRSYWYDPVIVKDYIQGEKSDQDD
jgi:putative component of membrane protein insertase Oxa1/YidC/SpoIIIJ protein YidD